MKSLNFGGKKFKAYGDSITEGYLVSSNANKWTSLLAAERNGIAQNFGVGGSGLQQAITTLGCGRAAFQLSAVPAKAADDSYLFLAYGTNDLIVNRPGILSVAGYRDQLRSAVDGLVAKGWAAADIVLVTVYYFTNLAAAVGECGVTTAPSRQDAEAYRQAVVDVAKEKGTVLADVYTAMQFGPSINTLLADGLHPNDAGARFIATFLENMDYTPQTNVVAPVPVPGSYGIRGRLVLA